MLRLRRTSTQQCLRLRGALMLLWLCLVACGLCGQKSACAQSRFTGRVIRVEAGDLLVARLQTWDVKIRLHGITCPTLPAASAKAQAYTSRRVLGTDITVKVLGTGPQETVYGEVQTSDGASLNEELAQVGLAAWASSYAPTRTDIASRVREAQRAQRGIWGDATAANVALPAPAPRPTPRPTTTATMVKPATFATAAQHHEPIVPPNARATHSPILVEAKHAPVLEVPLSPYVGLGAAGVGAAIAVLAALVIGTGFSARRLPFQILIALMAAFGLTLMVPLLLTPPAEILQSRTLCVVALAPPLIALAGWQAVALCRREQILRAAPERTVAQVAGGDESATGDLVRVRGMAAGMYRQEAFVSSVGAIPGLYLREITQIYEAIPTSGGASSGASSGERTYRTRRSSPASSSGSRRPTKRYAWRTLHDGTWAGDFCLTDETGGDAVVVEGTRAAYFPTQTAHFYNEVPVEKWFDRPYPGDTRTAIDFIAPNAPLLVWGRVRRIPSPDGGSGGADESRLVYDAARDMLVVTEGEGAAIWSSKPLVGLLLTLVALGLAILLAYCVAAPGALDHP